MSCSPCLCDRCPSFHGVACCCNADSKQRTAKHDFYTIFRCALIHTWVTILLLTMMHELLCVNFYFRVHSCQRRHIVRAYTHRCLVCPLCSYWQAKSDQGKINSNPSFHCYKIQTPLGHKYAMLMWVCYLFFHV